MGGVGRVVMECSVGGVAERLWLQLSSMLLLGVVLLLICVVGDF